MTSNGVTYTACSRPRVRHAVVVGVHLLDLRQVRVQRFGPRRRVRLGGWRRLCLVARDPNLRGSSLGGRASTATGSQLLARVADTENARSRRRRDLHSNGSCSVTLESCAAESVRPLTGTFRSSPSRRWCTSCDCAATPPCRTTSRACELYFAPAAADCVLFWGNVLRGHEAA